MYVEWLCAMFPCDPSLHFSHGLDRTVGLEDAQNLVTWEELVSLRLG